MGHMSMKKGQRAAITLLVLLAGAAQAQDGLVNNPEGRWTSRLTPQRDGQGQLESMAWLSDYHFDARSQGGLRATTGVVWGLSSSRMASPDDLGLAVDRGAGRRSDARFGTAPLQGHTAAYAGIGYTHLQAGWRLHADMGLAWRLSQGNVKLGPTDSNGTALEDVLRNARLAPLMQLSASYTF